MLNYRTISRFAVADVSPSVAQVCPSVGWLGVMYPFALVLRERWRAKHSFIDGKQLVFTGSALGLFGRWILWLMLIFVTLGVYLLWVAPRIQRWKWQNTDFAV
jgi:uncharacterized membrane protein YjgN (DUF898 family)